MPQLTQAQHDALVAAGFDGSRIRNLFNLISKVGPFLEKAGPLVEQVMALIAEIQALFAVLGEPEPPAE